MSKFPDSNPYDKSDQRYWDFIFRFSAMLRGIGHYELVNNHGIYENYLTVRNTRYMITRTLPNDVVDAIYRLAAGRYPITLEFIVEFLKRSKNDPILECSIVIPPEVTNFFDNLELPQDQSVLLYSKLAEANLQYERALESISVLESTIKVEKRLLKLFEERNSEMWAKFVVMLNSRDLIQRQMEALKAFISSVESMKKAFGPQFTLPTTDLSLPTIDDLQAQISELRRVIALENFKLQPARYEEVSEKKSLLDSLNAELKEAAKIKEQSLKQIEKIQLNIQLKKLGLTEIA